MANPSSASNATTRPRRPLTCACGNRVGEQREGYVRIRLRKRTIICDGNVFIECEDCGRWLRIHRLAPGEIQ